MESSLSESVQQSVRPGKCVDLYYPDPATAEKACFRTTQNTKFIQAFNNTSQGTNTFVIPPSNGIQDVVLVMELPQLSAGQANGLGLNRAWGYSLIKSISFRYGGSSQFFLSKQQLLELVLRKAPNGFSRNDLLSLGGSASSAAQLAAGPQRAYVWLPLPHCVPTSEGKLPPFPSDLLTQQIIVQAEIEQVASIYSQVSGATSTYLTTGTPSLSFGEFQVQQVMFDNQGDALARRVDMSTHALSYPVEFTQQEVTIPLGTQAAGALVNTTLTGFRAGECRNIHIWITADSDSPSGVPAVGVASIKNPFAWYRPDDITMTYAGEVFAKFDKGSSALWNLVNSRLSPQADDIYLQDNGAGGGAGVITVNTGIADQWAELPFAQTFDALTAHSMYTAGRNITNGIVNLSFRMPLLSKLGVTLPTASYTLRVSYNYNAVLMLTGGTSEYVL